MITGVILAGGRSLRMGGRDKAMLEIGGRSLIARVIERARPQVGDLIINANHDPSSFHPFALPVLADSIGGYLGPLAGLLTGLEWVRDHRPDCHWLASFAADTPLIPADLVNRLHQAIEANGADMACAASGGRAHLVIGLWPVHLARSLRQALTEQGLRKMRHWTDAHRLTTIEWPIDPIDPFFNVNTPEDARQLAILASDRLSREECQSG